MKPARKKILLCTMALAGFLTVLVAMGELYQRALAAEDARYESNALDHIQAQLSRLKPGMSMASVHHILYDHIVENPRSGSPLHTQINSEFGRRAIVIRKPDGAFLVFDFDLKIEASGKKSPSDDDWKLVGYGTSFKPYLR